MLMMMMMRRRRRRRRGRRVHPGSEPPSSTAARAAADGAGEAEGFVPESVQVGEGQGTAPEPGRRKWRHPALQQPAVRRHVVFGDASSSSSSPSPTRGWTRRGRGEAEAEGLGRVDGDEGVGGLGARSVAPGVRVEGVVDGERVLGSHLQVGAVTQLGDLLLQVPS